MQGMPKPKPGYIPLNRLKMNLGVFMHLYNTATESKSQKNSER